MRKVKRRGIVLAILVAALMNSGLCCSLKADGLVGDWRFNESSGTTATDDSMYGNDGTLTNMGAAPWITGISGNALGFDGIDDYVEISNPGGFSSTTGSISFWMKAADAQNATLFHFYEAAYTDYIRCYINENYDRIDLVVEDDNVAKVAVDYDLKNLPYDYVGEWIHVAWVQDGTGVKLYINGEAKTLNGTNSSDWWTNHLSISTAKIGSGSWGTFDGCIDEFKVYDRALSTEEVIQDYELSVSLWHFDEETGSIAYDECGQNDATITGAAINQDGSLNRSYLFDGVNDKVTISSPDGLSSNVGTIEFWMKADDEQNAALFHFYEAAYTDYIRCYMSESYDRIDLVIEDDNDAKVAVDYDLKNLPHDYVGEWIHVAWVQDGTGVKLYIDGEAKTLNGTNSGNWWTDHLDIAEARIGYGSWGYFYGGMDEFMVYNRALGVDEIYQKYVDHGGYKKFGCEEQPTGDPIGGGVGYSNIFSANGADYDVDTKTELFNALASATSGDVIFVSGNIDLSGENTIIIPGGVTLAGDRGCNDSEGALLKTDTVNTSYTALFVSGGSNIRITGLRIQGPGSTTSTTDYSDGIRSEYSSMEVDNCEISAWGHAGIALLDGGTNAYVHHNYIHHCQRDGLGYGISHGYGEADSLIEANKFDYNRHSVAGTGTMGNSYEARYNLVLEHATGHVFDMHGGIDRQDGTSIAGDNIYIHHNTVMVTDQRAVCVRGIPNNEALIYSNWFYWDTDIDIVVAQINAFGNFSVNDNLLGTTGTYVP